ncbi:DNA-binding response regulator [bacterium 1XD42-8]|jgi:DNA-binding LytR/AlgR family response regulator|nr:response regulator transcription factor [Lachnospiraceae bacterium]RKJ52270.1 DNA-binding response regulator [bacterium 1XD42-8]
MINIAICDSEKITCRQTKEYVEAYGRSQEEAINIWKFSSGEELLNVYFPVFHIIIMEIWLSGLDGIKVARALRDKGSRVILIFLTSSTEHVLEAFEVEALHYLKKPIKYRELALSIDRAIRQVKMEQKELRIGIRNGRTRWIVEQSKIKYIETWGRKTIVYTEEGKMISSQKMYEYEKELAGRSFIRCHTAYIVNIAHILKIEKGEIVLTSGESIPLSRKRRKDFTSELQNYVLFLGD